MCFKKNPQHKKIELLAPAGNFEKLEIAAHYGADAVYLAGKNFSLRNFADNFTLQELSEAVKFAHDRGIKIYVACNIYPRNCDIKPIEEYLRFLGKIVPDAVIVADVGIAVLAQKIIPNIELHLSTQANTTNYQSAEFWKNFGVKRINTARELSLDEIKTIAENSIEVEVFAHGAMCISYSGRCLLSNFMTNRGSNQGMCAHPCRWKYAVVEEKRPGVYLPVAEDDRGFYIFNSKDICMIEHIPALIQTGIASLKIEGRMKGINYLASVVKTYREAIESYYDNPETWRVKNSWIEELNKINHRGYCTGFYFGHPDETVPNYLSSFCVSNYILVGKTLPTKENGVIEVDVRNKIIKGDEIEILSANETSKKSIVNDIFDMDGTPMPLAQPGNRVMIALSINSSPNDLLRIKNTLKKYSLS